MSVAPGTKTSRYRIWQAIRVYRRFKAADLIALGLKPKTVRNYLCFLKSAGIVCSLPDGYTMLVRNLGPLPPGGRDGGRLSDPNADLPVNGARVLCAQRLGCLNCTKAACGECAKSKLERQAKEDSHG